NAEIISLLRSLHAALGSRRRTLVVSRARRIETRSVQLLGPLLATAAYWAVRNAGENNTGETTTESGRDAIEVADAIRIALFARSAARVATWEMGWPDGSSLLNTWYNSVKSKSFESAFRAPPITTLAAIARKPENF